MAAWTACRRGLKPLYRVTFEIKHRDCYATDISARFPRIALVLRESVPLVGGHARDIICVRASSEKELAEVAAVIGDHPNVRRSEVLSEHHKAAFLMVEGRPATSIIDAVTQHRGFRLSHTHAVHGREHWSVGIAKKDLASAMLAQIALLGELNVTRIARGTFPELALSEAQRRVLRTAIDNGYYDFPRQTSPTDLARKADLAKSTLLEHLRKAEAKVVVSQDSWI